jgi:hypothetical protein
MPTWASTLAATFLYSLNIEIQPLPVSTVFVRLDERNLWYFFQNCLFPSTFRVWLRIFWVRECNCLCQLLLSILCLPLYLFDLPSIYYLLSQTSTFTCTSFFLSLTLVPSAFAFSIHRRQTWVNRRSHFLSASSASRSAFISVSSRTSPFVAFLSLGRQENRMEGLSHTHSYTFCAHSQTFYGISARPKTGMEFRALPRSLFEAQRSSHFTENRKLWIRGLDRSLN